MICQEANKPEHSITLEYNLLPVDLINTYIVVTGSKSGDYEELKEKIHTKVLGNHSLLLQNVKEDKQGYYMCQASNGIGNAIGKVIRVNVKCK